MTEKEKIRSLERELKMARLDVCELCQRLGEDICTCGGECAYAESGEDCL